MVPPPNDGISYATVLETWSKGALARLNDRGLLRNEAVAEGPLEPSFSLDGRLVLSFSSNCYLGFASDPRLVTTMQEALQRWGVGSSASRLVGGTHVAHRQCEAELASFSRADAALLFSSGYAANLGVLSALMNDGDIIYSDALNHASIIDGCRLSKARTHVYRHRDIEHLRSLLTANAELPGRRLIVTDALFSMDGHLAPLRELRELADEFEADLMVDEAHSIGVLGPQGRGACAAVGVRPEIQIGTLGKAFGVCGAYAAASESIIHWLKNRARSYVFSTAPPPALAETIRVSLGLVMDADERRHKLLSNARRLRDGMLEAGLEVPPIDAAIVPLMLGSAERTMQASQALLERGIYARGIRPPTVPEGTARLRLVPIATHTDVEVERALEAVISIVTTEPS